MCLAMPTSSWGHTMVGGRPGSGRGEGWTSPRVLLREGEAAGWGWVGWGRRGLHGYLLRQGADAGADLVAQPRQRSLQLGMQRVLQLPLLQHSPYPLLQRLPCQLGGQPADHQPQLLHVIHHHAQLGAGMGTGMRSVPNTARWNSLPPPQSPKPSSGPYHIGCLALVLLACRELSGPGLYQAAVHQGQPTGVLGWGGDGQWGKWGGPPGGATREGLGNSVTWRV